MSLEGPLPTVAQEQFDQARHRVESITSLGLFQRRPAELIRALPASPQFKAVPGIKEVFQSIAGDADYVSALTHDQEAGVQVLMGATLMFLLLSALGKDFLPTISENTIEAHNSHREIYLRRLVDNLHKTGNTLEAIQNTVESTDYVPFSHNELHEENPPIGKWVEEMDPDARLGATRVYGLVRSQAAANQMRKLWGE